MTLVVVRAFPGHARGERITDQGEVARVLAGEWAYCVVKVLPTAPRHAEG